MAGECNMSFAQKLSAGVRKHLSNLQDMHDKQVKAAEERAKASVERARTKTEREQAKQKLAREKLALKREYYEAKTATHKAKTAMQKARKEAGDLTVGERVYAFGHNLYYGPKKKRKTTKRKVKRNK